MDVRDAMRSGGPKEPSADFRQAAAAVRQVFIALMNEGFSEQQALKIIGYMLAGQRPQES